MAIVWLRADTEKSQLGYLAPIDVEINAGIIDIFYATCLMHQSKPEFYILEHDASIRLLHFENPFDVQAFLKSITVDTAKWVANRTIFYRHECEKRDLENKKLALENEKQEHENEMSRQAIISKKLDNAAKVVATRDKLVRGGFSVDEAMEQMGTLLHDQRADLKVLPPPERAKQKAVL